jgi:hypothetical protein
VPEDARLRKNVVMAAGLVVMAALCVAVILLAGSRPEEASTTSAPEESGQEGNGSDQPPAREPTMIGGRRVLTEREALVQDARWYARDMGVPLKEAIRRLQMQDDSLPSDLEREIKQREPDAFAGLWLRHKPDYGVTVAFAGDPERAVEIATPLVEGTQWEGTVNVKRVEASMKELNAARAEAQNIVDRLGISRISSDLNVSKNRAEFYVPDKAKFERRLDASGLELPEHVAIIENLFRPE